MHNNKDALQGERTNTGAKATLESTAGERRCARTELMVVAHGAQKYVLREGVNSPQADSRASSPPLEETGRVAGWVHWMAAAASSALGAPPLLLLG